MTPTMDIEVIGVRRRITLTAIIDTGFDGELSVPINVAVTLGLELIGHDLVELADGSHRRSLRFGGSVRFLEKPRDVSIYLTESEDVLIGTAMLDDCRLSIDFPSGKVTLSRKRGRRGRK